MTNTERPFLDFYEKHSIIPTKLEITDKEKFFKQRNYLFETLGIPLKILIGASIFELGPGTGQKLGHLLSLSPSNYVGVDNNRSSLDATQDVIQKSGFRGSAVIHNIDFLKYEDTSLYDLVLAELVIPTQRDPGVFLKKLINMVSPQGIMIFNCIDPISMLSETLRKAIIIKLGLISQDLENSSKSIVNFFALDLDLLPGMNREKSSWAIDQIIKPAIGPMLSIPKSLDVIANSATFHGSSPRFVEDYRWYKDPSSTFQSINKNVNDNYWMKCHNFLDHRNVNWAVEYSSNRELFKFSEFLYSTVVDEEWSMDSDHLVAEHCGNIIALISQVMPETAASLKSFLKFWQSGKVDDLDAFRPWWGRGTQYISVIKS